MICASGPTTPRTQPDRAGTAYRRVVRDHPPLGAGQVLSERCGAHAVAVARQDARDCASCADLKIALSHRWWPQLMDARDTCDIFTGKSLHIASGCVKTGEGF